MLQLALELKLALLVSGIDLKCFSIPVGGRIEGRRMDGVWRVRRGFWHDASWTRLRSFRCVGTLKPIRPGDGSSHGVDREGHARAGGWAVLQPRNCSRDARRARTRVGLRHGSRQEVSADYRFHRFSEMIGEMRVGKLFLKSSISVDNKFLSMRDDRFGIQQISRKARRARMDWKRRSGVGGRVERILNLESRIKEAESEGGWSYAKQRSDGSIHPQAISPPGK